MATRDADVCALSCPSGGTITTDTHRHEPPIGPFQIVCHMGNPNPKLGLHGRVIAPTLDDAIQQLTSLIDEQIQPNLTRLLTDAPAGKPGHLGIGPAGGLRWRKAIYLTYTPNGDPHLSRDRRGKKPIGATTRTDLAGHIRDWATANW